MDDIQGHFDPAFAGVKAAFEANFAEDAPFREVGAAVSVLYKGKVVVDLWGGLADADARTPWTGDTLVHVFSTSKGFPAIAMAQLVANGKAAYSDPIARHWPEFAQNGKEQITIAQVLSHQSGVNAFDEPITAADMPDWDAVCARLAAQAPAFDPGTVTAYHAVTYGHIIMEVVRRVTGLGPAEYVATHIASPLGADVSIGVPESEWSRVATLVPPPPPPGPPQIDEKVAKAIMNPMITPPITATPDWRNSAVPAVNSHVSARGLARVWGAIANGGELDGARLLAGAAIEEMIKPLSDGPDLLMGPGQWAAGVSRNRGNFGPRDTTFGSFGFGGSLGIADPALGVGIGYTPNRLFPSILEDPRAKALAAAAVQAAIEAGA